MLENKTFFVYTYIMKTSTVVLIIIALAIIVGGIWLWLGQSNNMPVTSSTGDITPTSSTDVTPVVAAIGARCGGNMQNAPVCAQGSHCAPVTGSNLPFGDVGGTCVADNTALYVPGNFLLAADTTTSTKVGTHLVAYNAMTLYRYTKDTPGVSHCTGQCAVAWPPYIVDSTSTLGNLQAGITGKVDVFKRDDGTLQVTYKGVPLYFYVQDKAVGDVTGQNVGGVWFVVAK
jgi:predicted lipoprotein with Yx(FWY)xxD motif